MKERPSTSGWASIAMYGIVMALIPLFIPAVPIKPIKPIQPTSKPYDYQIDLLPTPDYTPKDSKTGPPTPVCVCYQEFHYEDDDKVYQMESDRDGAPAGCQGITDWASTEIVVECDSKDETCAHINRVNHVAKKMPHVGWGFARRICNWKR